MKKLTTVFAASALALSAYTVQASADSAYEYPTLHDKVHAMSAEDRANFRQMMHDNMDKMTDEQRQAFKEKMRAGKKGCDKSHKHDQSKWRNHDKDRYHQARHAVNSMPTMERADFANTMRNNIKRMSYQERQAFFDYMGLTKQQRHEVFERLGVKHHDHKHQGRSCDHK